MAGNSCFLQDTCHVTHIYILNLNMLLHLVIDCCLITALGRELNECFVYWERHTSLHAKHNFQ
jgi:hypothetical protein